MNKFRKMCQVSICITLVASVAGCGTLLYPERKGQKDGRIDAGVAVLDGLGLLFFIIPGVVAFAIDFSNGTIYLPGTASHASNLGQIKLAKFDPKRTNASGIERIIERETGCKIKLNQKNIQISRLESVDEIAQRLAQISPKTKNLQVASHQKISEGYLQGAS